MPLLHLSILHALFLFPFPVTFALSSIYVVFNLFYFPRNEVIGSRLLTGVSLNWVLSPDSSCFWSWLRNRRLSLLLLLLVFYSSFFKFFFILFLFSCSVGFILLPPATHLSFTRVPKAEFSACLSGYNNSRTTERILITFYICKFCWTLSKYSSCG